VSDPAAPAWLGRGQSHVWRPYTQAKTAQPALPVVRTEGVRIHLADGRTLIDGIASWWTACHGYNHPTIRASVSDQLERLPHVMFGGLAHEPAYALAAELAARLPAPLSHVFFSDSGSVAVEVALKIALQYQQNVGRPEKSRFAAFFGGYHGDTFLTMSVCDPDEGMHARFARNLPVQDILQLPIDDASTAALEAHFAKNASELAAVIVEPLLQGAGGMRVHSPETLARIVRIARAHEVLVIFDEIATGFGRTGKMFAMEHAGVIPDLVCLGKALTGGTLPLAATIATEEIYATFLGDDPSRALMHGPTFMANPLACRAALASLSIFDQEPRLAQSRMIADQLERELSPLVSTPHVRAVRVLGAMGAVELDRLDDREDLRRRFVDEGVWIRPLGKVVYLMPALSIGADDLGRLTRAIAKVLA
jgi:adenosylmethionine-8-amino-7-oxononanoate aminotransferase